MLDAPTTEIDEAALVARVLDGDVDAFETIVVRWQRPLIGMAFRFCRDHGRAEDLAQEVLLKVFRALPRWKRESRFSTWMFAIALNHYRSSLRRHIPPGVEITETHSGGGDRRLEVESSLRDEAIRAAVATLPARYRDVIILYYFQERDVAETARVAGLREGTVKARLYRARRLLRAKLGERFTAAATPPRAIPEEGCDERA